MNFWDLQRQPEATDIKNFLSNFTGEDWVTEIIGRLGNVTLLW